MNISPVRAFYLSLLCFIFYGPVVEAQEEKAPISEPARVQVEDLMKQADLVVIVHLLSGDTEHYPKAVYKAEVLQPFKGA